MLDQGLIILSIPNFIWNSDFLWEPFSGEKIQRFAFTNSQEMWPREIITKVLREYSKLHSVRRSQPNAVNHAI